MSNLDCNFFFFITYPICNNIMSQALFFFFFFIYVFLILSPSSEDGETRNKYNQIYQSIHKSVKTNLSNKKTPVHLKKITRTWTQGGGEWKAWTRPSPWSGATRHPWLPAPGRPSATETQSRGSTDRSPAHTRPRKTPGGNTRAEHRSPPRPESPAISRPCAASTDPDSTETPSRNRSSTSQKARHCPLQRLPPSKNQSWTGRSNNRPRNLKQKPRKDQISKEKRVLAAIRSKKQEN